MTSFQITTCAVSHRSLNAEFYRDFLWGKKVVKNRPSSQDILKIIAEFKRLNSGHTMYSPYALRAAIVILNR